MNPRVRGTIIDCATEAAMAEPSAPVFLAEEGSVDCASILADAEALASALWERGLRPGNVVAFQLPNWVEAAVVNLAASRLGLVCAPLMPIYREAELSFMLGDSGCRAIFIPATFRSFDFEAMYVRLEPMLAGKPLIFTVRGRAGELRERYEDLISSGRNHSISWPPVSVNAVKLLLYTSGTTGRPKAVLHSHETLARAVLVSVAHWHIESGDAVLMPSPVTHATGYANALELPFLHGTQTVLMDRWDAHRAVSLIDRYGVVATVGATPFLRELTIAARERGSGLESLRVFACGGASVAPSVIDEANSVMKNQPAFRVYGSSEAPYVALGRPGEYSGAVASSTDGEVIDYETLFVDEHGNQVAEGDDGEILVRGPALFLRYANDSDNRDSLTPDGFFRTGDMGRAGPGRYLTITGRKKDLIIRGGENISAKEIEDLLHECPSIAEAAVVSMPHPRLGEGICAFVIAREGHSPDLDHVLAFLGTRRVSRQKYPERLEIIASFPRTASGKIRKDLLRQRAADIVIGERSNDGTVGMGSM